VLRRRAAAFNHLRVGRIGTPAAGGGLDNRAFARYPDSMTFSATGGGSWPS
jgi:hypothetical protein